MVTAQWRRFVAGWHTEIDDRVQMARLRARLLVLGASVVMISLALLLATSRDRPSAAPSVLFEEVWLTVVLGYSLARGSRMTDPEFFVLLVIGQVNALVGVVLSEGHGHVAATALSETSIVIVAALFMESRVFLAAQFVVTAGLVAGTAALAPPGQAATSELGNGLVTLLLVLIALRVLRDLSVRAVGLAKRGEVTDPLTGLANRRGLERQIFAMWGDLVRTGRSVAALVVDVDHFKRINDTRGHAGGDQVLRALASVLTADLRPEDIAVRLGGEEFVVLSPTQPGQGVALAERLRRRIERDLAPVTVSIGVHERRPAATDDPAEAIWGAVDVADQALYAAKNGGRNQVRTADSLADGTAPHGPEPGGAAPTETPAAPRYDQLGVRP